MVIGYLSQFLKEFGKSVTPSQKEMEDALFPKSVPLSQKKAQQAIKSYNRKTSSNVPVSKAFIESISKQDKAMKSYLTGLKGAKASMNGYTASLNTSKIATIGMTAASAALQAAISFGISIAIQGVISLFDYFLNYSQKVIEKGQQASEHVQEISQSFADQAKSAGSIKQEYAQLVQGVDALTNRNLTLNDDDYTRFLELQEKLAEMFPELSRGFDSNGQALLNLNGDAQTIVSTLDSLIERQRILANMEILKSAPDLVAGANTEIGKIQEEIGRARSKIGALMTEPSFVPSTWAVDPTSSLINLFDPTINPNGKFDLAPPDQNVEPKVVSLYAQIASWVQQINAIQSRITPVIMAQVENSTVGLSEPLQQMAKMVASGLNINDKNADAIADLVQKQVIDPVNSLSPAVNDAFANLFDLQGKFEVGEIGLEELQESAQKAFDLLKQNGDPTFLNAVVSAMQKAGYEGKTMEKVFDSAAKKLVEIKVPASLTDTAQFEQLRQSVTDLDNAYGTLSAAVSEYNDSGALSINTLNSLLSLDPQYRSMLISENGALQLNEQALQKLAHAQLDEMEITIMRQAINTLQSMTDETKATEYLAQKKNELAIANKDLLQTELDNLLVENAKKGGDYANVAQVVQEQIASVHSMIDKTRSSIGNYSTASTNAAQKTQQLTEALTKQKDALQKQRDALQKSQQQAQEDQSAIQSLLDMTIQMRRKQLDEEQKGIQKIIDALEEKFETEKKGLEETKKAKLEDIDLQKESLRLKKEENDYAKDLAERTKAVDDIEAQLVTLRLDNSASAQKKVLELESDLADAKMALEDFVADHQYEKEREALDKQSKEAEDYYDGLIDQAQQRFDSEKQGYEQQLENLSAYLDNDALIRQQALDLINRGSHAFYEDLKRYNYEYGTGIDADVKEKWDACYTALDKYNGKQRDTLGTLNGLVTKAREFKDVLSGLDEKIAALDTQLSNLQTKTDNVSTSVAGSSVESIQKKYDEYVDAYNTMSQYDAVYDDAPLDERLTFFEEKKKMQEKIDAFSSVLHALRAYHTGGIVGDKSFEGVSGPGVSTAMRKLISNLNSGEVIAKLQTGEAVLTQHQQRNLFQLLGSQVLIPISGGKGDAPSVVMGDIIVQGNADTATVHAIRKVQQETVDMVFDKMNKLRRKAGIRQNPLEIG